MGRDDFVLVKQGKAALRLQNPLDDEHHIWAARIIFIKCQSHRILQRPRQQSFAELSDLFTVFEDNRVFTDQINTADMAV